MQIRPATTDDVHQLAVAHVAAWRTGYRGTMPDAFLDGLSVEQYTVRWTRWLTAPGDLDVLVGEVDGRVVGFTCAGPSRDDDAAPDAGELQSLDLHPAQWGGGYGSALTHAGMVRLAERGHHLATLWVVEGNDRARRTYAGLGRIPDGARRTESFGGGEVTEVRLRVQLVPGGPWRWRAPTEDDHDGAGSSRVRFSRSLEAPAAGVAGHL